jgi:hypothetical protein
MESRQLRKVLPAAAVVLSHRTVTLFTGPRAAQVRLRVEQQRRRSAKETPESQALAVRPRCPGLAEVEFSVPG